MTAIRQSQFYRNEFGIVSAPSKPTILVQDTYWGYIIQSVDRPSVALVIGQTVAWLFGLLLAVTSIGLWVVSDVMQNPQILSIKMGASVLTAGMSVLLLWYASRGTNVEVQIDTRQGEVREIVRNRAGTPSLVGRYGFDSIGGVFLDRKPGTSGEATLVLRYRNTASLVSVAHGSAAQLEALKDRLGRDMLIAGAKRPPAVDPMRPNAIVAA